MKRWLVWLALAFAVSGATAREAVPLAEDEAVEQRLNTIAEELRCLVCQNESLAGSRADLAQDLRREIRSLIRAGKTDPEILDYLVSRYGDFVRYRPPLKPTTWLLWLRPLRAAGRGARGAGRASAKAPRSRSAADRRRALARDCDARRRTLMGAFLFAAMSLVAITLLALLRPWQGRRAEHEASVREINAGIYRDQLAELDRDLAAGVIAASDHAVAREELQRRLLDDAAAVELPAAQAARGRQTLLAIAIGLPLGASALYALLGEPAALLGSPTSAVPTAHQGPSEVERMVAGLAARLEKNPDPKGWAMLGRSYHAMGRFAEAAAAFAKVGADLHKDPLQLAIYADALASAAGGNLEGEPTKLVAEALQLDPDHPMALSLAATAAYKRRDFAEAARHWQHLLKQLPPGSEDARWVAKALTEIGVPTQSVASNEASSGGAPVPAGGGEAKAGEGGTPADGRSVGGIVSLAPALQADVRPDDTVFVFARPTDGSRMPLAVQRARVADLPLRFRLDDSMAMSPQAKISGAKEVRIEALVSRRGTANAAPGDLTGTSPPVAPGNMQVALTIDRVRP